MIPYGRQHITQADIDAVKAVLESDFLTQGPQVPRFEQAVAGYVGVKYAVAVNSATSALHIACRALGLTKGDSLWTTPITFVASANCALYCDAIVDFVDIDEQTYNMNPIKLETKLEQAKKEGRLPKIVVAVHFSGQSCDMQSIYKLSKKYNFKIIEDASHAIGGTYNGEPIGNCRYSDITVFSFHPVKIITTGEGGMAVTNEENIANQMELLRSHGITRDQSQMTHEADGPWYYQQVALGFNYRMTDLQAALGVSQMQRINEYIKRRSELANRYNENLSSLPITLPYQAPNAASAWHLYVVRLELNKIKKSHRQIFESLRENGIGVNLHYIPVHTQPYYANMGFKKGDFLEAEKYYAEAISLPLYATLSNDEQDKVVEVLGRTLSAKLGG